MRNKQYPLERLALVSQDGMHYCLGDNLDDMKALLRKTASTPTHIEGCAWRLGSEGHELAEHKVVYCPVCEPHGMKGEIVNADQTVKCPQCGDRR